MDPQAESLSALGVHMLGGGRGSVMQEDMDEFGAASMRHLFLGEPKKEEKSSSSLFLTIHQATLGNDDVDRRR